MASREPASRVGLSGDDLIAELLRNMEEGLFRVRFTTLVPCVYHVYLHPDELDEIRPIVPHLQAEARRALDERLAELDSSAKPIAILQKLGLDSRQATEHRRLADEWTVEFLANHDPGVEKGDVEVSSELAPAPRPELGAGSMTRRITRRTADGTLSSRAEEAAQAATPEHEETAGTVRRGPVHARLRFEDGQGLQVFEVSQDLVVIGRGGKSYWVDLKLRSVPDVSREHCRLRRDPDSGAFFLKDVSQFGTTVDGQPVPRSVGGDEGQEVDRNIEVKLPARARIGLADRVFLDFEATGAA